MSIYDDPDVQKPALQWTADVEGKSIAGIITEVTSYKFPDDDKAKPVFVILPDGETDPVRVTASQNALLALVWEHKPLEGDWIKITYIGKSGNSKKFTLEKKAKPTGAAADPTA